MTASTRLGDTANAAAESVSATAETAREAGERLRDELGSTERRVREFVEEYPLTCFLGAVLAGYLAGRIATRL